MGRRGDKGGGEGSEVLTRGEEACSGSGGERKKSLEEVRWEKGRCVLFKGVDV